ncbi:MAG: PD-(D/E)XK nuclease family protein [Nostoc sp. ChiQUE02]|uniref:PDDEXK-like family protein n=1 Tax=Nostoc sp. ChiQUE02 TaxID=3075377 RepID=UPI002AD24DA6|nr:PD-(D/E)XK nuclease family protein [Nostoc sp. ChiQUE02]MDZ8234375.1 PD-(D/E)XK nuclease family protein [Nostoc sp. ChiQUE02]
MPYTERALLESLIVDNEDLEKLELKLAQFNIFEAIGVVHQELRHSNFLAFLLNPSENHRLDDIFLKRFLKRVLLEEYEPIDEKYTKLSPVDIDIANFKDADVRREWQNIDILIHSPRNKLVCAIENKVDAGEGIDQLKKYQKIIEQEFKDCRAILIYLTPEGDLPSQKHWRIYNYSKIAEIIDSICISYKSTLGTDIYTLMTHYSTLIRRHIVSDSEVAELCRKIYTKHKHALDLIFEHRSDSILKIKFSDRINLTLQRAIAPAKNINLVQFYTGDFGLMLSRRTLMRSHPTQH